MNQGLGKQPDSRPTAEGVEVEVTRQELGRIVGCSREMASRVMKTLEDRGIVTVDGKTVIVRHDPQRPIDSRAE